MVFWIIVIICLLTLGATLFFIFDPAKKEWEKIDHIADRLSDAYWDLAGHKGFEDPEVKELKAQREEARKAREDFKKTRKYHRVRNSEEIIEVLGTITITLAVIILIIGVILGFVYMFAEQKRAEAQAEVDAKGAMQAVLNAIHSDQLARDKAVDDAKIETEQRLAEIEAAKQKAYAETVEKIMKSIQPELVAAMNAKANAELTSGLGNAIAPYAIAQGESVSQAVTRLLKGTTLEETIKNIGAFKTE